MKLGSLVGDPLHKQGAPQVGSKFSKGSSNRRLLNGLSKKDAIPWAVGVPLLTRHPAAATKYPLHGHSTIKFIYSVIKLAFYFAAHGEFLCSRNG